MDLLIELSQSLPGLYYCFVLLLGVIVGSFLNVVIYRLPIMLERQWRGEYQSYFHPKAAVKSRAKFNLWVPSSRCPHCGHPISAKENVPLVSWCLLHGRCSRCQHPISVRYPLVELGCGLLSLVVAVFIPPSGLLVGALLLTWSLIVLTLIDLDKMLLPDEITLPLLWGGLLFSALEWTPVALFDAVIGASCGYLILWSIYWAFKLLTGKEGMGYGDFKLLAALGAWLGWQMLPLIILLSSLLGAIVGIGMILVRKNSAAQAIPFGPYLAGAGWIALLFGYPIINSYLAWAF